MEENNATETTAEAAPTIALEDDAEAVIARLEAEKAKLIEEKSNYQVAYLKATAKQPVEDEESERIKKLAREVVAESRIAEINKQQEELLQKVLKENKELKLAHLNKTNTPPAAMGSHNESVPVRDTLVTHDQMEAFKARGWSEKDIERYKKNLQRYSSR
jgi:uncharacterized protein (DUF2384 family)